MKLTREVWVYALSAMHELSWKAKTLMPFRTIARCVSLEPITAPSLSSLFRQGDYCNHNYRNLPFFFTFWMNLMLFSILLLTTFIPICHLGVTFVGQSYIVQSFQNNMASNTDTIIISFRTAKHNGILFYGYGPGDSYILIELVFSRIRFVSYFQKQTLEDPFKGWVGQGLSDNGIHQIEIYRDAQDILMVLDRGTKKQESTYLVGRDFNRTISLFYIYLGGNPQQNSFPLIKSISKSYFEGCIESANWKGVNLLDNALYVNTKHGCVTSGHYPISFLYPNSFFEMYREPKLLGLDLSFKIMVYTKFATLLSHQTDASILNISIHNYHLRLYLAYGSNVVVDMIQKSVKFNDGNWHYIRIRMPSKADPSPELNVTVDEYIHVAPSPIYYKTLPNVKFGGVGFIGCINELFLDRKPYAPTAEVKQFGISYNGCNISSFCVPNPCLHGGTCTETPYEYQCKCLDEYKSKSCILSSYTRTCSELHQLGIRKSGTYQIDLDRAGPLRPITVECINMETYYSNDAVTKIVPLVGNQASGIVLSGGSGTFDLQYTASHDHLSLLTKLSQRCSQGAKYYCTSSKITNGNVTMLNWVGADKEIHHYWNKYSQYGKCDCAFSQNGCPLGKMCSCDINDKGRRVDITTLSNKDHLPLLSVHAIDISDSKGSSAQLAADGLLCNGFGSALESVTFQEMFAYMSLPTWDAVIGGTLAFEFKTTMTNYNTLAYSHGRVDNDFILIELVDKYVMRITFSLGDEFQHVIKVNVSGTGLRLNDNEYHVVFFLMTVDEAELTVDGVKSQIKINHDIREAPWTKYQRKTGLNLDNSPFYLGGNPYQRFSGFKGTIRSMYMNGEIVLLSKLAKEIGLITPGVHSGPFSSCSYYPNACNHGLCVENYNYYTCNCSVSPYNGKHCEIDNGIDFNTGSVTLPLTTSLERTMDIAGAVYTIGFRTKSDGVLFFLNSDLSNVFLLLYIEQGQLVMDVNFENQPRTDTRVTFPTNSFSGSQIKSTNLLDGNVHVIQMIHDRSSFTVQIDESFTRTVTNEISPDSTVSLKIPDNVSPVMASISSISIGGYSKSGIITSNTLSTKKFSGCIVGMKAVIRHSNSFDSVSDSPNILRSPQRDHVPSGTSEIDLLQPHRTGNGRCGNNLKSPPGYAPLVPTPPNRVTGGIFRSQSRIPFGNNYTAIIIGLVVWIFFAIILALVLFLRFVSRNRGVYDTNEGNQLDAYPLVVPVAEMENENLGKSSVNDLKDSKRSFARNSITSSSKNSTSWKMSSDQKINMINSEKKSASLPTTNDRNSTYLNNQDTTLANKSFFV